jgi:hypothetical protein
VTQKFRAIKRKFRSNFPGFWIYQVTISNRNRLNCEPTNRKSAHKLNNVQKILGRARVPRHHVEEIRVDFVFAATLCINKSERSSLSA